MLYSSQYIAGSIPRNPLVLELEEKYENRQISRPGPGNAENSWKVSEEDGSDPGRCAVRTWRAEVPVDNDDSDENGENVHDEREEQVLGDQRNVVGCRR